MSTHISRRIPSVPYWTDAHSDFFELREAPFNDNPDPRYLYLVAQTRKVLSELTNGINAHQGCILLTGEIGTGKTTLIHCLIDWLWQQKMPTAFMFNCLTSVNDLLESILISFGISFDICLKANMLLRLNAWLAERARAGETPVLIVDEAQSLPFELLHELGSLLNIEAVPERRLQIVLAGQCGLEGNLQRHELRQLRQRIIVRCTIAPLTRAETHQYIQQHLRIAGAKQQPIFEFGAMDAAFRFSQGIPRVLNLLCEHALIGAFLEGLHAVPARIVENVAREFAFDDVTAPDFLETFVPAVRAVDLFRLPPARASDLRLPVFAAAANIHSSLQEGQNSLASGMLCAVACESPVTAQIPHQPVSIRSEVESPKFPNIPAKSIAVL